MSGPAVVVAGLPGAVPDELAAALTPMTAAPALLECPGRPVPDSATAGVLAVDLTCAAGSAEEELLDRLTRTGAPIALVGVGAGQDGRWPARLAAARTRLDPGHRLPVFAVSLELLRAGDPDGAGLGAVAQWCNAPGPVAAPPAPHCAPGAAPPTGDDAGFGRAERLAGARAGFAGVRAQVAAASRAGAQELGERAHAACERLGRGETAAFTGWLQAALEVYRGRISAELTDGIEHVRATATAGLPGGRAAGADPSEPIGAPAAVPVPPPGRLAAEDLVLLALGGSAGLGLGRVMVAPLVQWAGLGAAGTVLTVLAGLAVAAGVVTVRRQSAARAALRRTATETIVAARSALEHAAAARLGAAEAHVGRELWNRIATPCVQPSREPSRDQGASHERLGGTDRLRGAR